MNLKEAKELLAETFNKAEVYIYTKEERDFMRKNILKAISEVPS